MHPESQLDPSMGKQLAFKKKYLTPAKMAATVKLLQDAFPELPWAVSEDGRWVTLGGIEQTAFGGALNNLAVTLNKAIAPVRASYVDAEEKGDLISTNINEPKDGKRYTRNDFFLESMPFVDNMIDGNGIAGKDDEFMNKLKANADVQSAMRAVRDKIALAKAGVIQKTDGRSPA